MDVDTADSAGNSNSTGIATSSRRGYQQQHDELLVPRGLDLLPSMRAPRRLPPTTMANGSSNLCDGDGDGAKASKARETAAGRTIQYVPWIGGSANLGHLKSENTNMGGAGRGETANANGIQDRVQWFPRGLPMEATPEGGRGQDERESAMFSTRASMAMDRLGEQVRETGKRQAEMEIKRREKVRVGEQRRGVGRCACLLR